MLRAVGIRCCSSIYSGSSDIPEVYIIAIPAFGVISQVIPAFSRKPLFGYASMVYATASIAVLSFLVWAHHMYTTGIPLQAQLYFMFATMLIAVPTGVKVFNWIATMWKGSLSFETPMLFALGFLFLFTLGGFTGLVLSIISVDVQLHDTYYVVAHFHYVMVAGALFSAFAGIYFWLPKWIGKMYNETLGKWHFWLSFFFFNLTFFVQHFLGLAGMPRRIPDYALQFADFNKISSIGAFGFGLSQLLFLYIVIKAITSGEKVAAEAVGGRRQPGVDRIAHAGPLPHLRDPAGDPLIAATSSNGRGRGKAQGSQESEDRAHSRLHCSGLLDRISSETRSRMSPQGLNMQVLAANREVFWKLVVVAIAMFGFGFAHGANLQAHLRDGGINKRDIPAVVANTQMDADPDCSPSNWMRTLAACRGISVRCRRASRRIRVNWCR